MPRSAVLFPSLIAIALAATACGGGTTASSGSPGPVRYVDGGTFTMATQNDLGSFDPYQNRSILGFAGLTYDSLVNLRPDGAFVSGLARSWTADANGATFTLRRDVTCSDGTPLTASQIAADLTYVSDPKNSAVQYGVNVPTVPYTAVGDDATATVRVTMGRPFGLLLNTLGQVPIVCASGMHDRGLLRTGSAGTGPFVLTSVAAGQSYTFAVRKGYAWGPGGAATNAPGTPATVVVKVVADETTAANLLLSGGLNFAKVNGQDQQRLHARGLAQDEWKLAGTWLSFNQIGGRPTADERVRRALVGALRQDQVIKVSTGGTGSAPTGLVSMQPNPCPGDTVSGQLPRYDVAAAGALLDQAGWRRGPDGMRTKAGQPLTIDLHYSVTASPFERPAAELLAQQWESLGLRVRITPDSRASLVQVLYQNSNYDVYSIGYNFSLPSQMVPYLSGTVPPHGNNVSGINNPTYDQLAATAGTMAPPAACDYWKRAEQAIVRDVDVAPLSNRADSWFLNKARARIQRYDAPVPTSIRLVD